METPHKDYNSLEKLSKHTGILQGIVALLDWDQETYMPSGAAAIRAEQLKTMAGLIHRERTSRKFSNALSKLVDISSGKIKPSQLASWQVAAIREWRRNYLHDTALPSQFVETFAQVTSQAIMAWREAKKARNFSQFAPFLNRIVELNRQKADLLGYQDHPYDALLDEYEPDVSTKEINRLFSQLSNTLQTLIRKLASQPVSHQFLFGSWDKEKQLFFSQKLLDAMGYDRRRGRLDFSSHPFSSASHPTDSRITTRLHPTSLMSHIFVVLHEAGHALYEMGLPQEHYGTPLGEARSLGVHESQSKWWETQIGASRPFWEHFFPLLKETFKGQLDHVTLDAFYQAINKVEPSLIRVEADEVTYPLHILLRFELEKALVEGSLSACDLPDAWNAKMEALLGIIPKHDAEGCLQDIHWAMGAFGYFPTYALGSLYAAHLFEAFAKDHPDWQQQVASGELGFIRLWLHDKIYQHGKRYPTLELLEQATGNPFSADAYLRYLNTKYASLYRL